MDKVSKKIEMIMNEIIVEHQTERLCREVVSRPEKYDFLIKKLDGLLKNIRAK